MWHLAKIVTTSSFFSFGEWELLGYVSTVCRFDGYNVDRLLMGWLVVVRLVVGG